MIKYKIVLFLIVFTSIAVFECGCSSENTVNLDDSIVSSYSVDSDSNRFINGTFEGNVTDGVINGKGVFRFSTGEVYEGEWKDNNYCGSGSIKLSSDRYDGEFSESKYNGKGKYSWNNGDSYEGDWVLGKMSGQGTYYFADGSSIKGSFNNNEIEDGNYIAAFVDGTIYDGEIKDKRIDGSGKMTYPNGDFFEGSFVTGSRNGKGTYSWSNGDKYIGEWKDDAMNGIGKYFFSDGNVVSGGFISNHLDLTADFTWSFTTDDNDVVTAMNYNTDSLQFSEYEVKFNNGDRYTGSLINGKFSGQGKYIWKDGSYYEGQWLNGEMNGIGELYYNNISDYYKLSGEFSNGKPNGNCLFYSDKSDITKHYNTIWENGKCVGVD